MRNFVKSMLLAVAAGSIWATPSRAVVVTFNGVPSVGNPVVPSLATDGYTFASGHFHTIDSPTISSYGGNPTNGTISLSEEAGSLGLPITMTATSGAPFTLVGFDGAEGFINSTAAAAGGYPNAFAIRVVGNLSGGGTVSADFTLDALADGAGGIADFQTFAFPATFTNLSSAVFSGVFATGGPGGGISLDNINVVPEPTAALALLAVPLLGRRRR